MYELLENTKVRQKTFFFFQSVIQANTVNMRYSFQYYVGIKRLFESKDLGCHTFHIPKASGIL
jgi:hypothetical protein